MADPVEVRRVVIQYDIPAPNAPLIIEVPQRQEVTPDLVEQVRRELIRNGSRNPDIFGGRA